MRPVKVFVFSGAMWVSATVARAQDKVPVRELSSTAKSVETFGAILSLRELPGGRVLVDDGRRRLLTMFDSTLTNATIVLDSAGGVSNSYGSRGAPLVGYLGDSSLFVDYAGQAFLMIDPAGRIGRAMAPPNARDLNYIGGSAAAVDAQGRLVYRGLGPVYGPAAPDGSRQVVGGTASADSLPILRGDFQKRTVDTLTRVRNLNSSKSEVTTDGRGQTTIKIYLKPLPEGDEWAVLSDGSIAIVRGHDYHIDWIAPDGSRRSTPKMPFDWRRLTESDKQRIVDSLRAAREAEASASAAGGAGAPGGARGGSGGGPVMVQAAPMPAMAAGGAGDGVNRLPPKMEMVYPLPGEMPDYLPPIRSGAARADRDGNLWILPSTSSQSSGGELVYDVVNLKGEVFQRVRVPAGRSIAGFGKGGVVFLQGGDMRTGLTLERMRIKVDTKS